MAPLVRGHVRRGFCRPVTHAWRRIPLEAPVWVCFWRVPAAEAPRDRAEVARWLFAWWARIDAWIAGRAAPPVPSTDEQ